MAETFVTIRSFVYPLFWPLLWLNLLRVYARHAETRGYLELRVSVFGRVRVAAIYPDPVRGWRDDLWDAVNRQRPKGNAVLITPPEIRLATVDRCVAGRFGTGGSIMDVSGAWSGATPAVLDSS